VVRTRKGRVVTLHPMMERNKMWRKVQSRLQWSRTRPRARKKRTEPRQGLVSRSSKTGESGFSRISSEREFKDHRTRDSITTSSMSIKAHTQLEEKDLENEGSEAEGRGDRKGER
jgi:hypothetical protein